MQKYNKNLNSLLGNYVIPSGTGVVIAASMVHRDPRFWPNPEVFDPDRFMDADLKHPYSYIPFSAGSRNCIGKNDQRRKCGQRMVPDHHLYEVADIQSPCSSGCPPGRHAVLEHQSRPSVSADQGLFVRTKGVSESRFRISTFFAIGSPSSEKAVQVPIFEFRQNAPGSVAYAVADPLF